MLNLFGWLKRLTRSRRDRFLRAGLRAELLVQLGPSLPMAHERAYVLPRASKHSRCKLTTGIRLLEKGKLGGSIPQLETGSHHLLTMRLRLRARVDEYVDGVWNLHPKQTKQQATHSV